MIKLRTHAKAFEAESKIYAFQNIRLPAPISVPSFLYFLGVEAVVFALGNILPAFTNIPSGIRFIVFPYLITNFLRKKKFDGKPPHIYLRDYIQFLAYKNQNCEFFRVPERQSKDIIKLKWKCTHRNT